MREKIRNAIFIIILAVLFVAVLVSNNVFAAAAGDTTSPVNDADSKKLSYNSIFSLVDPSQRRGDQVYIRYEDLIKFPSLFCAAHGYSLPGYNSTLVYGHDTTDSGKVTGYLTAQDTGETVGWNEAEWTTSNTNTYHQVTSKTYGLFKVAGVYKATPAEAWVLSEMDKNDPKKNSINFEITTEEYDENSKGKVNDGNKIVTATGDELWSVEWDESSLEPTKFVTKKDGKYYYVKTDSYAPYTYVQHAWWKVKEIGKESKTNGDGIKDTDLAAEAKDFESYMEKIAILNSNPEKNRDKWQYNEDNTIKVDFTKYKNKDGVEKTLGYDNTRAEVRFNSETNKYVVGPFKLNYLRETTKQGSREKVSFSGISQTTLTAADDKGNKLLDSEGKSVLQLGKNYRFVFDNPEEHKKLMPAADSLEDYPYPYDDEDFYIEIDYLDNMVSLVSLDVDFQYMNAGAEFEYLTGKYLIITWTPMAIQGSQIDNSGTANATRTMENINLAMATDVSDRAKQEVSSRDAVSNLYDNEVKKVEDFKNEVKDEEGSTGTIEFANDVRDGESDIAAKINLKKDLFEPKRFQTMPDGSYREVSFEIPEKGTYSLNYTSGYASGGGEVGLSDGEIKLTRHMEYPIEEVTINVKVKIKKTWTTNYPDREPDITTTVDTCEFKATLRYANKVINGVKLTSTCGTKNGDTLKIDEPGNISEADLKILAELAFNGGSSVKNGKAEIKLYKGLQDISNGNAEDIYEQNDNTTWGYVRVKGFDETVVQEYKFYVHIPKMHLTKAIGQRNLVQNFSGSYSAEHFYTVYNHLGKRAYFKNGEIIGPMVSAAFKVLGMTYEAAPLVRPKQYVNGVISIGSLPENANDTHHTQFYLYSIVDNAETVCFITGIANLTNPDKKPEEIDPEIEDLIDSTDSIGEENQGGENQGGGNQGGGNQGGGNQGGGNQGGGNQGGGNQGGGNQGGGNQEDENPNGGDQDSENTNTDLSNEEREELIRQYEEIIAKLEKYIEELRNEINNLQQQRAELRNKAIAEYTDKYNQLKNEYDNIVKQIEEVKNTKSGLENKLANAAENEKQNIKNELTKVENELVKLENERDRLVSEINTIVAKIDALNELISIENRKVELDQLINSKKEEVSQATRGLNDYEKQNIEQKSEEDNNSDGLSEEELLKQQEEKNKQNELLEESKSNAQATMANAQQELTALQQEKDVLLAREKELLNILSYDLNSELLALEKKIQSNEDIIEYVQAKIDELKGRIESADMGGLIAKTTTVGGTTPSTNPSRGGGSGGGGSGPSNPTYDSGYYYKYYLKFLTATSDTAQDQINGTDAIEVDIDAANGAGNSVPGPGIHLELITNPINLRTSLSGMVWIDHDEQKDDATYGKLGVYDEGEKTADKPAAKNSVEIVVWKVKYDVSSGKEIEREKATAWDKDGNVIDFIDNRIYVDENGKYEIPEIQVPAEEGLDGSKYVISYDVEFIYDGQTYEATEYLVPSTKEDKDPVQDKLAAFKKTAAETAGEAKDYTEYVKSSYIVENATERNEFDKYFTEVYGKDAINDNLETNGKATGGKGGSQYNNIEHGEQDEKEAELQYTGKVTEKSASTDSDIKKVNSTLVTNDKDGYVLPQFRFAARTSEGGLLLPYERLYHVKEKYYDNYTFQNNQYKPVDEYFNQINLGLLEREVADVSVIKDLYTANVVVNEHLSTYHYNKLGQLTDEALTLQETLGYRKQKYSIDLYNSDYYYRSSAYMSIEDEITKELVTAIKEGTELQLFLTYRIQFTNESPNMNVSINEFKDYYDSSFTLITNEMCENKPNAEGATQRAWSENGGKENTIGEFKKYVSSVKAAGEDGYTDTSREPRTVAYSPYYRKLTTVKDEAGNTVKTGKADTNATSTSTTETPDPANTDYYWNRDEDIDKTKVNKVETSGTNLNVNIKDSADDIKNNNGYKTFTFTGLKPEESIKNGKLPNEDALVIEPNETIEFYVSYQVDVEGFNKASEQSTDDATKEAETNDKSAQKNEAGNITQAVANTVREKLTGAKSNIVEITKYSTGYNYLSNEKKARHSTVSYSNDNISGRIDQDSAPDNMNIAKVNEWKYTEDDNEFAPTVQVSVKTINDSRSLTGMVWEDSREEKDGQKEANGNGILDADEKGIGGIDVTMVEKIRVTKADLLAKGYTDDDISKMIINQNPNDVIIDNEFEYVWKTETKEDGTKVQQIPGFDAKKTSNEDGTYEFTNYPTGTFVVRFEYGNDADVVNDIKYNGQDYKNTAYQIGMTNPAENSDSVPSDVNNESSDMTYLAGKSTLNNEWHYFSDDEDSDGTGDRKSDARDYEPQRMRVIAYSRTLTNENAEVLASAIEQTKDVNGEEASRHVTDQYEKILEGKQQEFVDNTRMVANTAKFYVDVEKESETTYKTVDGKTTATTEGNSENPENKATTTDMSTNRDHSYKIKNIDFGLVERPETRINVRKEIKKIQLLKNDGKDVILTVECDENGNIIKQPTGSASDSMRVEKVTEITKEDLGATQGFKYIAMEANFLKGLQVKLTYKIDIYNNSEIDYIGGTLANIKNVQTIYELADNFENNDTNKLYSDGQYSNTVPFISGKGIVYGRYLGSYYYTNDKTVEADKINETYSAKIKEEENKVYDRYNNLAVVTTTVDQLVDYVDNDLSIALEDTANIENQSWVNSSDSDRQNKLSIMAYRTNESGNYVMNEADNTYEKLVTGLQDDKERAYVVENNGKVTKNNISLSVNATMTEKPKTITYNKIKMAEKDGQETTQAATGVNDVKTGTLTVNADKTATILENAKPQVKYITFNTAPVTLNYIYTTVDNVVGNQVDTSNGRLTKELVPSSYDTSEDKNQSKATINIVTTAQANEEAINSMNYDNLVEVAMYSNTAGRRDMQSIPGNANMIAKDFKAYEAGYNYYYKNVGTAESPDYKWVWEAKEVRYTDEADLSKTTETIYTERDAYAARDTVTFSEPTGLSLARQKTNIIIRIILVGLIIAAFATIGITVTMVVKKTRYDDKDLLNPENKN